MAKSKYRFSRRVSLPQRRSTDLSLIQYRDGAVDFIRVLDSERFLVQQQDNLAATQSNVVLSLVSLYKALGGGWQIRDGKPFVPPDIQKEMITRTNWDGILPEEPGRPPEERKAGGGRYGKRDRMSSRNSVALLLLLSSLLFSACDRKEPPPEEIVRRVPAMRVGEIVGELGRSFPGRAQAYQELNLSFRIGGPLIQFPVKVGEVVKKGQVLARIDPRDYDVGLRQAQGQLEETRASVAARGERLRAAAANFQGRPRRHQRVGH